MLATTTVVKREDIVEMLTLVRTVEIPESNRIWNIALDHKVNIITRILQPSIESQKRLLKTLHGWIPFRPIDHYAVRLLGSLPSDSAG
jgi:hypothetical protein